MSTYLCYSTAVDPTHQRAHDAVASGREQRAEVRHPNPRTGYLVFEAWAVSETSYAWRTSTMAAPAFGKIER